MFNISFIIPAYNEAKLLPLCITSIRKEIQRYPWIGETEIIVVDNNSTDNTAEIAKNFGCTVIYCLEKGVTRARQAGFEVAKYEIQAYIDADNCMPNGWLKNIYKLTPDDVVCIAGPVRYNETSKTEQLLAKIFYLCTRIVHHVVGPSVQGGNFVVKRSALLEAGGMPVDIDFYGEDTKIAYKLSKIGKVKLVPKMWIYSSARRLENEGSFKTACTYALNYLSIWIWGKPWTTEYKDHRN